MKSLKTILLSSALLGLLPLAAALAPLPTLPTPPTPPPAIEPIQPIVTRPTPTPPANLEGKSLTVVGVTGSASSTDNQKTQSLKLGDKVQAGSKFTLGEGSSLTLKVDDNNVIVIAGPASFEIEQFTVDANGKINAVFNLTSGSITVDSPKADGAIVVKTPTSTVTVDQGVAKVTSSPEGTNVIAAKGTADVVAGETKKTVETGTGVKVTPATTEGGQPTVEDTQPTQQEQQQILNDAQKAQEDLMKSQEPVTPEAEKQSENTEPSNPSTVVSGEQQPPV